MGFGAIGICNDICNQILSKVIPKLTSRRISDMKKAFLIIITKLYHQYDALIGDGRAGVEAPSCERGVHVRTCRYTPHLTCVSLLSNGSLAAHQVQTQSAQQFARYGKRMCTCARADATHPDLCKARIYWAPSHTQNLNAQPYARSGKRVCTCARADALHLRHVASTYLMGP